MITLTILGLAIVLAALAAITCLPVSRDYRKGKTVCFWYECDRARLTSCPNGHCEWHCRLDCYNRTHLPQPTMAQQQEWRQAQWGGNLNNSAYAQQNATAANAAACPTGFGVYSYMLCTFGGCMAPAAYGCKTCGVAGCANHPGIPHSPLRHMSPGRI